MERLFWVDSMKAASSGQSQDFRCANLVTYPIRTRSIPYSWFPSSGRIASLLQNTPE